LYCDIQAESISFPDWFRFLSLLQHSGIISVLQAFYLMKQMQDWICFMQKQAWRNLEYPDIIA
jgi:hypothetical protein